jgi:hypothetical protein
MSARPGPCGGRSAMVVPTAISLTRILANKRRKVVRTPVTTTIERFPCLKEIYRHEPFCDNIGNATEV